MENTSNIIILKKETVCPSRTIRQRHEQADIHIVVVFSKLAGSPSERGQRCLSQQVPLSSSSSCQRGPVKQGSDQYPSHIPALGLLLIKAENTTIESHTFICWERDALSNRRRGSFPSLYGILFTLFLIWKLVPVFQNLQPLGGRPNWHRRGWRAAGRWNVT